MVGARQNKHRRWYRKHLAKMLWLLLLLAPIGGFWLFMTPSPRTAWLTEKQTHIVGFAADGKILVTTQGWRAGPIGLWCVETGTLQFALAHDWSEIDRIEFSPDGRFLAAQNNHEHLIVWNIATGEEQLNRKLDNWFGFRFCPDGKHIVFQGSGPKSTRPYFVHFWNIATKCVDAIVPGTIMETAVAQDGKSFAQWHWNKAGSAYSCVQFWKIEERTGAVALDRQFDMTFCDIAFLTDLETFVTVSRQSLGKQGAEIAAWDSVTGRKKAATTWQHPEMWLQFMFFSPDDKFVIADIRGDGRKVVKWDVRHDIKLVPTHAKWEVDHQSPDGKLLLIAKSDGAELLDAVTHAKRGTLHKEGDHLPPHFGSSFGPRLPHFAFSADSKLVIATGLVCKPSETPISDWIVGWFGFARPERSLFWSGDPVVRLYDAGTASEVFAFQNCSKARFSPDGRLIATVHEDGKVQIWHAPPRRSFKLFVGILGIWLALVSGAYVLARLLKHVACSVRQAYSRRRTASSERPTNPPCPIEYPSA